MKRHVMRTELARIAALYADSLKVHGVDPRSVGWRDEPSQKLRFQKLSQVIDEAARGCELRINELGCGYGAMFGYLRDECSLKMFKYYGYDISEDMLACARDVIKDERAVFLNSDRILYEAEYSFASGIFNVKFDIDEDVWKGYIQETLFNMYEKSKKGFAFNALTTYVDYKADHLYYADPLALFDFCKKNFSKRVSLLHDYGLWEWTILVKMEV
jgi:SAM-dependent methyltransferase